MKNSVFTGETISLRFPEGLLKQRIEVMDKIDKADLEFFKKRIQDLSLEAIYTNELFHLIQHAIDNIGTLEIDFQQQRNFYINVWNILTYLNNCIFVKKDDLFFNSLRAMEYEYAGRALMISIELNSLELAESKI